MSRLIGRIDTKASGIQRISDRIANAVVADRAALMSFYKVGFEHVDDISTASGENCLDGIECHSGHLTDFYVRWHYELHAIDFDIEESRTRMREKRLERAFEVFIILHIPASISDYICKFGKVRVFQIGIRIQNPFNFH